MGTVTQDLIALTQLIRELGFKVNPVNVPGMGAGLLVMKDDHFIVATIATEQYGNGTRHFITTAKIPGVPTGYYGHGIWKHFIEV